LSNFLNDEEVPPVPPLSMSAIEDVGEQLLEELVPAALREPTSIDLADWAEHKLGQYGIFVYPASSLELRDRLGATDPSDHHGDGSIQILIEEEHYDSLLGGGRVAHRARGTVLHELGHCVLHVPVVRERMKSPHSAALLSRRVRRDSIPPFKDPEWQAWALGGCIVAPRRTILMTSTVDPLELGEIFGISTAFMKAHLTRLRLIEKGVSAGSF
jgi:hypothetical protein